MHFIRQPVGISTVRAANIGVWTFGGPHLDGCLHEEAVAVWGAEVELSSDGGAEVSDRGRGRDLEQLRRSWRKQYHAYYVLYNTALPHIEGDQSRAPVIQQKKTRKKMKMKKKTTKTKKKTRRRQEDKEEDEEEDDLPLSGLTSSASFGKVTLW